MVAVLTAVIAGFAIGWFTGIPFHLVPGKFQALIFLALLDGMTFGLARDFERRPSTDSLVFTRFVVGLIICGFIIYFGEKSGIDLYIAGLMPLIIGFALNMYKFLPK